MQGSLYASDEQAFNRLGGMSLHSQIQPPRGSKRARVLMTGILTTPAGQKRIRIKNISRTGAQVASDEKIPADCDVLFKRGNLFAAARVAWVAKGEAGIRFYRELSPEEIDGRLPTTLLRKAG